MRLIDTRKPMWLLVLLLSLASGCATVGKDIPGIYNFAEVEKDVLYRGGQPTEKGIKHLSDRGVKTVVNLRADPLAWEKDAVEKAGMQYVWLPSLAERTDSKVVARFLSTVRASDGPVLVHCRVGRDRTGLNVAAYRICEQGWDRHRAIKELHAHGYHWAWFPGIERYLKTFDSTRFASAKKKGDASIAPTVEAR
jgi:uncharacterized protein (TIGR01244 family)